MSLNSFLFHGKAIPAFDDDIVTALKLTRVDRRLVEKEWMLLGIRNEAGDVYRVVGVTGKAAWDEVLATMRLLGYVNELDGANRTNLGCDALFYRPY